MRFFATALLCVGVLLTAAACDPVTDQRYFREGAGVDLYTNAGVNQTELQNLYVDYICQQAGLVPETTACGYTAFSPTMWSLFVQAGMNDIDQRCDSYLTWLDAQRRNREPVLAELAAVGATTHAIMTVSGATPKALDIVSSAFGLASATYSNWNSRLLLSVNQSTVQQVVYSRQTQFRETVKSDVVADRPHALYLLRNYLRICMPTTIEADINTSTTLVVSGNGAAAETNPLVQTVPAPGATAVAPGTKNTKPNRPTPTLMDNAADIFDSQNAATATVKRVTQIQNFLCVPDDELGKKIGPETVALVHVAEQAMREPKAKKDGKLDSNEIGNLRKLGLCKDRDTRGKNYFERITFTPDDVGANALTVFVNHAKLFDAGKNLASGASLVDVRKIVPDLRTEIGASKLAPLPASLSDQITYDLYQAVLVGPAPKQ